METARLGSVEICRVLNGMWQVAGGHGRIEHEKALAEMVAYHDSGFTSWDLADIYGPAEDFVGDFRRRLAKERGEGELARMQAFTKFVPEPGRMTKAVVEQAVEKSRRRMGAESIDLVQFHWWDYSNPAWLDALVHLSELRDAGRIRNVGLTNFDTAHMQDMADEGLKIVSNQVQYSIIDQRPQVRMQEFCRKNNSSILAYGTVCGGMLSEKYLGKSEPGNPQLDTLSLRKYKKMIDMWGGWKLFQELLAALKAVADRHRASVANVACRYILDRPAVAGVIVGARLGIAEHRQDNARIFGLKLDGEDRGKIEAVTAKSQNLFELIGDCGDEYRY
ncbi:aldo/keto reductase [Candidatus Nitrososphaera sp. FF02]|uniref:aldo/keto reductase n=1 Tax=Candidatus Nitrososphaera sp. FF02 TaxID=3398226 RepID=UPI0039EB4AC5